MLRNNRRLLNRVLRTSLRGPHRIYFIVDIRWMVHLSRLINRHNRMILQRLESPASYGDPDQPGSYQGRSVFFDHGPIANTADPLPML